MVKNPPAMKKTLVQSLSWEDPLEKGMAIHSSILTWRIPWTEKPGGLWSKALYCHPAYLTYMQNTSCEMWAWLKRKLESRLLEEISITSNMQMTSPFIAESKEELNSFLMKVKEESEKAGLKLNIQKTKIMASGPITSWQIDGETVETVADFIFGGLQNHCRW